MEEMFGKFKTLLHGQPDAAQKPSAFAPRENEPSSPSQSVLERARSSLEKTVADFENHVAAAVTFLPPLQSEKFKPVANLPLLFEQKIREIAAMPKYAHEDFLSPGMQDFLKSYLTNNNAKGTGEIITAMQEVLTENAIAPAAAGNNADIVSHQFFQRAPMDLIQKISAVVMAERAMVI